MSARIDHHRVQLNRDIERRLGLRDRLAFVEEAGFLEEATECGMTQDDLDIVQITITITPTFGDVVPVTRNIRDLNYELPNGNTVVIRYVYLPPPASTVLLLTAYAGPDFLPMTFDESQEAEAYIEEQIAFFSNFYTK